MNEMRKNGRAKRQHYVPQMVLRNFSKNRATVSLVVLRSGQRVEEAPINRQCYESYFYGADQVMEKAFASEEAKVSRILGDLSPTHLANLSDDDIDTLRIFMHYQHARTRAAAESVSRFATAFMKTALRTSARLNREADLEEGVDELRIRLAGAQNLSLEQAMKTTPLVLDLEARFLVTSRTPGFLIGDHPVVAYNQFAEHHPKLSRYPTSTGLALKGLQLFFPLSPSVTLALYDSATYLYDGRARVCGAGPRDVRFLNEMQAVNAWECIFFNSDRSEPEAIAGVLSQRNQHPPFFEHRVLMSDMVERSDGTLRQFVAVIRNDVKVGARFSFVRTIDKYSYAEHEGATIPTRSPDLIRFTKFYGQQIGKELKDQELVRGSPTP